MQLENISTPIYVEYYEYIDQRFVFKNSGILCLALVPEQSRSTILHAKNWLKVARYHESYTIFSCKLIRTYGLVVKASHSTSDNLGLIPTGC